MSAEGALGIIPRHSVSRPRPLLQLFARNDNTAPVTPSPAPAPAPPQKPAADATAAPAASSQLAHLSAAQRQRLLLRKVETVYAAVLELQDREDDNVRVMQAGARPRNFSELAADLENEPGAGGRAPTDAAAAKPRLTAADLQQQILRGILGGLDASAPVPAFDDKCVHLGRKEGAGGERGRRVRRVADLRGP